MEQKTSRAPQQEAELKGELQHVQTSISLQLPFSIRKTEANKILTGCVTESVSAAATPTDELLCIHKNRGEKSNFHC